MFSVRTDNILLNYFVVLFTLGIFSVYRSDLYILFFGFLCSGILLFFDRYFYFKTSFLLLVIISIFWLLSSAKFNLMIILILFIALSQIHFSLSYLALFFFLFAKFDTLEIYLIFSIFIFSLAFAMFYKLRTLRQNFYAKLFNSESRYSIFRHNIANLCSIIFLKNKDKSLDPVLEEIRSSLHSESTYGENSKFSIAGLLRITICFLNYDYNLKVKENFFILGDDLIWVCFFYTLLENYGKRGSTIVVKGNSMFVVLTGEDFKSLDTFLSNQLLSNNCEIERNILKINYGM